MTFSRRQFHKYSAHILLGALFPNTVLNLLNRQLTVQEVGENFQNVMGYLKPATDLLVPTFLGNDQRRFYGRGVPEGLNIINKFKLGTGITYVGRTRKVWSGAGWTGQPTITRDRGRIYLIIG
ncbi:MAG: hypothetical protein SWJ54_14640, partial [Cyanobacteriota bacterium]|nr:hypothetical protein [Cyanobacteriota bacterium]